MGVHVAYVMIDAVIDLGWTAIAVEVWHVAHQPYREKIDAQASRGADVS
jgi:hypothetical protein